MLEGPAALLAITSVADVADIPVGVFVTEMVHELPGATAAEQVLVWA